MAARATAERGPASPARRVELDLPLWGGREKVRVQGGAVQFCLAVTIDAYGWPV